FDPESQRSLDKVGAVQLLPGREVPLDDAALKRAMDGLRERFDIDTRRSALFQDLKAGLAPAGIEYYLPLFFEATATLFDYLGDNVLPVVCEGAPACADAFWTQTGERHEQRRHDIERPLLPPGELYLPPDALRERLNRVARVDVLAGEDAKAQQAQPLGVQPVPAVPVAAKDATPAAALKSFLASYPGRVLIAADSAGRREALLEVLDAADLRPATVGGFTEFLLGAQRFAIGVAPLDDGFAIDAAMEGGNAIAILTERQLFPERAAQPRRRKRAGREPEQIIRDLGELTEGAPIVHEDHGVGRYRGLITLEAGGQPGEYLEIEYAKGDRLYVPVAQLDRISRYSGASPETAPLHNLGGEQWTKAKRKAAEKVRDVAAELLEIQAKRQARAGLALQVDRALYEPFAATFPFEETPDQHAAIEAVIRDLGSSQPMDRVVCGDVGFGKTEVAVRAAFVAATCGKQVAVLVPTTLLAEQHYRNFRDRFADWPLKVEVLSRFKSTKEIKAELDKLAEGKIDVIVGTHRLLQNDVRFKDLGLVIVDEEQRFGVRQKEALKALRANVHLLTLTATPIPRTLNMAMAGLRDL
ncbi:MAG TPA: DEAD/DEAH box helicase, partial [Luteimonas sp.]|nr:DEAD/DEAH box helicase [Luteimonas sp.]